MINWCEDKKRVMEITKLEILSELTLLLNNPKINDCADYWIDNCHNIHVYVTGDSEELWIEAKMELYDTAEELIGDLKTYDTVDLSKKSLVKMVREIVKDYYME